MADENNTLTLRCRVICQEDGADYTPHIRIITTKDGRFYDRRDRQLRVFNSVQSPSDNTCNIANRMRDYEFHITGFSDMLDESIASCVLFYRSVAENINETCHTLTLAWIILPDRSTTMPPITTAPQTTPTDNTTQETTSPMELGSTLSVRYVGNIPDGAAIPFIIAVFIGIVVTVLIVVACFVYKRFSKTRKKKISIQPAQQLVVKQVHGGFYVAENSESVNNT